MQFSWNAVLMKILFLLFVINWMFSELPDIDANAQVLLLGVTRLDTPPRSSPPEIVKPKRPHTYHATTTTASDEDYSYKTTAAAVDDVKTASNRKFISSACLAEERVHPSSIAHKDWINRLTPKTKSTTFLSTKSKRNLNTFLGRFNRNSSEKDTENGQIATNRPISCPLVVEPPCHHDEDHSVNVERADVQPTLSSYRVKKSKTSRLASCIPYCASRHESSEAPTDSLASSFRTAECCPPIASNRNSNTNANSCRREQHQRQHLIAQLHRLRSPNELMSTNLSRPSDKSNNSCASRNNNNSSLFNNLNIMDRSVDSIGSCSLDVDAESTDFSGSTTCIARKCHYMHITMPTLLAAAVCVWAHFLLPNFCVSMFFLFCVFFWLRASARVCVNH